MSGLDLPPGCNAGPDGACDDEWCQGHSRPVPDPVTPLTDGPNTYKMPAPSDVTSWTVIQTTRNVVNDDGRGMTLRDEWWHVPTFVVRAALAHPSDAAGEGRLYAAVRRVIVDGIDSPGTYDELHAAFYAARATRDETALDVTAWPDRAWLISHWVGHRCGFVDCRSTEQHEHGGGVEAMTDARLSEPTDPA